MQTAVIAQSCVGFFTPYSHWMPNRCGVPMISTKASAVRGPTPGATPRSRGYILATQESASPRSLVVANISWSVDTWRAMHATTQGVAPRFRRSPSGRIVETARNDPHVCRRRCDAARDRVDRLERWEGLRAGSAVEKLEVNRCSVLHSDKLRANLFGM